MAEILDIIAEIEALTVHCRPPLMDVGQRSRWQQDWANDLKEFPIEAIRDAFRRWRHGENGKFPTPGQILPMVRASMPSAGSAEAPKAWSYDLTDDEYRSLSLHDKIRHHLIAAQHCQRKAGPQNKPREEMPEVWHAWLRRAENHSAEAAHLKAKLTRAETAA